MHPPASPPGSTARAVFALSLFGLLLGGACVAPGFRDAGGGGATVPPRPLPPGGHPAPVSHDIHPTLLPDGLVTVRLAPFEGTQSVTIRNTRRGTVVVERSGAALRASTGEGGATLRFEPTTRGHLTLGDALWPGTLTVSLRGEGGLSVTSHVPLEDYVAGVVARELILWSAEPAELEAQAIAARTYTLSMLQRRMRARGTTPGSGGAFLWSDTRDQAYGGAFVPEDSDGSRRVARRLRDAMARTRGRVLMSGPALVDARFHAACGGRTAALHEQFPTSPARPVEPVDCGPCQERLRGSRTARAQAALAERGAARPAAATRTPATPPDSVRPVTWSTTVSEHQLARLATDLGLGTRLLTVRPASRGAAGRWLSVELTGTGGRRTIGLEEFRRRLGPRQVASAWIGSTWPHPGNTITAGLFLRGRGRGHGVGLCQTGAHDRAAAGWSATRILLHYYPGAHLTTLPTPPTIAPHHPRLPASTPALPPPKRQARQ